MISPEVYKEMKALVEEFEKKLEPDTYKVDSSPYLVEISVRKKYSYNRNFDKGDVQKVCKCGHNYQRHFDSHEHMENVGCKYCSCNHFEEAEKVTEK